MPYPANRLPNGKILKRRSFQTAWKTLPRQRRNARRQEIVPMIGTPADELPSAAYTAILDMLEV